MTVIQIFFTFKIAIAALSCPCNFCSTNCIIHLFMFHLSPTQRHLECSKISYCGFDLQPKTLEVSALRFACLLRRWTQLLDDNRKNLIKINSSFHHYLLSVMDSPASRSTRLFGGILFKSPQLSTSGWSCHNKSLHLRQIVVSAVIFHFSIIFI